MALVFIALVVSAYVIGSVPTGVLAARAFGAPDPRGVGSGNIGATNVARTAGKKAGLATLAGDMLKGALPTYAATALSLDPWVVGITGLAALSGHVFPLFLGFKGGKGVATAAGVIGVVSPISLLVSAMVFLAGLVATGYVSIGSMLSALALPVVFLLVLKEPSYAAIALGMAALVIYRHRENIKRLRQGRENRFF